MLPPSAKNAIFRDGIPFFPPPSAKNAKNPDGRSGETGFLVYLYNMIYRLVLALRHLAFDKGWKKTYKATVHTICVGNITVGGTGKTPRTSPHKQSSLLSPANLTIRIAFPFLG